MRRAPVIAASGMISSNAARPRSAAIITGRRRTRSTHTPAKRPTSRTGADPAADSSPICQGVASRVSAAISGTASAVTSEPMLEIAAPAQNFRNSRCRQSEATMTSDYINTVRPSGRR